MKQRVKLQLTGTVQGVNLRSMIKVKALELELTGYVMNNTDGSVTLEAEGESETLKELISWISDRSGYCRVDHLTDDWSEATGEFEDFIIKY